MTTGSAAPHRAFIGVAATLCVCLLLSLLAGWQWFGNEVKRRTMIMERARQHEAKMKDMEKLGLDADAGILRDDMAQTSPVGLNETTPHITDTDSKSSVPQATLAKELPTQMDAPDFKEAEQVLEKFWAAKDVKDRLPLVFEAGRVEPYMRQYYEIDHELDPDHGELLDKKRLLIEGHEILYFSYKSNRTTGMLEIAMRRGDKGSFLIDWESVVGRGDQSFAELKQSRPIEPVMIRAFVRLFEYYNYEFTDSNRYLCVKMIGPNGVDTLYGFAERESELGRWLSAQLAGTAAGTALSGYTMRVAYPEKAQSDQCLLIKEVMVPRWLVLSQTK